MVKMKAVNLVFLSTKKYQYQNVLDETSSL